jgi:hypothetical protein
MLRIELIEFCSGDGLQNVTVLSLPKEILLVALLRTESVVLLGNVIFLTLSVREGWIEGMLREGLDFNWT